MEKFNSLHSANDTLRENSAIVNSLEDVKKFLASKNVKQEIIERVGVSFMAKIPTGTTVKIDEKNHTLHLGESVLKLGEDIFARGVNEVKNEFNTKILQVIHSRLPAVQKDRKLAKVA